MSARLSIRLNDNISLTLENTNVKDAIAEIEEFSTFFGESECGACHETDLKYQHRIAQGYNFYEIRCKSCNAKLEFGQTREGEKLFPKRKDKEGNYLPDGGWTTYQPTQQSGNDPF